MPSKQEIIEDYTTLHDELTRRYYSDPNNFPGGKDEFDRQHGLIWKNMEADLVAEGYHQLPGPTLEERVTALEARIYSLENEWIEWHGKE